MGRLSPDDWSRPSAVEGWTVGEVVAHLDLFVGLYSRFAGSGGSSGLATPIGSLMRAIVPSATPVFDTLNDTDLGGTPQRGHVGEFPTLLLEPEAGEPSPAQLARSFHLDDHAMPANLPAKTARADPRHAGTQRASH